ncbi:MAG: DNA mismatch repair protein MutS [Saprospiraceae bacterium]
MKFFYLLLLITIGYFIFLFFFKRRKNKKNELLTLLKTEWGNPKKDYFHFDVISIYFDQVKEDCFQEVGNKMMLDLDLESVFQEIDHTKSRIGQQYLYNAFRRPKGSKVELEKIDEAVEHFSKNPTQVFELQQFLSSLDDFEDYYFPFLIFGELPKKISWLWVITFLQMLAFGSIILAFFKIDFLLVLIAIFPINVFLHYWNKKKVGRNTRVFNRLSKIHDSAEQIHQIIDPKFVDVSLKKDLADVKNIVNKISWIKIDKTFQESEVLALAWMVIELIKIISLTEFSTFYKVIEEINTKKESFHHLFKFIGKTDFILSIASYRSSLTSFSKPIFTENKKEIQVEKIQHPLLEECVANDLHLENKSLLLTGSNMSGKTTFIRSVGVNVLLAQTIFTTLSEKYQAPFFKLATSIRISDDISEGKSYYLAEVDSINDLLKNAKTNEAPYLFIIDEVFKGTNTIERVGAARAILAFLNQKNHLVLVSTHDIELTDFLKDGFVLYHFQEQIQNDELFFDYKLKKGILQKRNAIRILELAEYPQEVIDHARATAYFLENEKSKEL